MRILVEAEYETGELSEESGDPVVKKENFWLLHWGLDSEIIETKDNERVGISYTVGICEHIKTGKLFCFRPTQLRIISKELKK